MRVSLLIAFSLLASMARAQFDYRQMIQGKAEISFSRKPAHEFIEKRHSYIQDIYKVTNGIVECIVDSKTFAPEEKLKIRAGDISSFYAKHIKNTLAKVNGKLITSTELDFKGLKWIEFDFTYMVKDISRHVYRRAIFFNRTFIVIDFVTLNSAELKDADSRNTFFESFEIIEELATIVQTSR